MSQKIHTFRAATMDEAMDLIRRKLGKDAIIVDSKEIAVRRLLPWPSTRTEFEVSAERSSRSSAANDSQARVQTRVAAPRTIRTLAESSSISSTHAVIESAPAETTERTELAQEQLAPAPGWFDAASVEIPGNKQFDHKTAMTPSDSPAAEPIHAPFTQNLQASNSLESLITLLEMQTRSRGMSEVPFQYRPLFSQLIEADIDDFLAVEMIATLPTDSTFTDPAYIDSPAETTASLMDFIERSVRCVPPIPLSSGRREIVTVIGPTGVGKTTVIAKLAAQFQLHQGRRVGLITVDNYRIGAIIQIQTYAEILQVPLRSASTSDELRNAVDGLDDVDVILIDTAGQSPRDRSRLDGLFEMLDVVASDHVLLVLSLAGGAKHLGKVAQQFAAARPTSLVVSKLDEAAGCGGLLTMARQIALPFQYITTGQDVPEMIEPANPTRLARLILGDDEITVDRKTASVKP